MRMTSFCLGEWIFRSEGSGDASTDVEMRRNGGFGLRPLQYHASRTARTRAHAHSSHAPRLSSRSPRIRPRRSPSDPDSLMMTRRQPLMFDDVASLFERRSRPWLTEQERHGDEERGSWLADVVFQTVATGLFAATVSPADGSPRPRRARRTITMSPREADESARAEAAAREEEERRARRWGWLGAGDGKQSSTESK